MCLTWTKGLTKWMRNEDAVEIWKWDKMFILNQSKFSAIISELLFVNPLAH